MYRRWEMDGRDLVRIRSIVADILDETVPDILEKVFVFRQCHDVHMEDYYYWLGWLVFRPDAVIYWELKWGSRGFHFDRIRDEIKRVWSIDCPDHQRLAVHTREIDGDMDLVLDIDGEGMSLMRCPSVYHDPPGSKELLGAERRQVQHFRNAEGDLARAIENLQTPSG